VTELDHTARLAAAGRLSRRDFMGRAAALGASAAFLAQAAPALAQARAASCGWGLPAAAPPTASIRAPTPTR
jgi:hypothetical protein